MDKLNGLFKEYNIYGQLFREVNYRDGYQHGVCKTYFGDSLTREVEYKYGKQVTPWLFWSLDGTVKPVYYC